MASPKHSSESLSTATILVAGRNGQLARCLRDLAIQEDLSLVSIGRPELDLESGANVEELVSRLEPVAIINAAAYTAVDRAEAEPEAAYAINRDGAARLAAAAQERQIPFVHISTDYVFDGQNSASYHEDDQPAPLNVYGRSKREGEVAVLAAYPRAVVIRTSWLYSPYGSNFVRIMLRLAATQSGVRVVNDQRGTPTSAQDLAAGILEIVGQLHAERSGDKSGIYHLAGQGETTWHDFAGTIFGSLARRGLTVPEVQEITTKEYPTPAERPRNSCLDSSKAHRIFGIQPAPWRASLEKCLDHLAVPTEAPAC